jgi:hypothetical protein
MSNRARIIFINWKFYVQQNQLVKDRYLYREYFVE